MATNPDSKTEASLWQKVKRRGVIDTYLGFTRTTQIIFGVMFVLGIALCAALWAVDVGTELPGPGWVHRHGAVWLHSGHSYIPNILAGFTGFLIGAPVAAVILATFTTQREEKVALDRVNRLSKIAWYTFRDAVYEFCTMERINAMQEIAPEVEKLHDEAYKTVQEYILEIRNPISQPDPSGSKLQEVRAVASEFFSKTGRLRNAIKGHPDTVEAEWSAVVAAWHTLDQYVRLQRFDRNLKWFDDRVYRRIRKWMSRAKSPFQEFVELHGFSAEADHEFRPVTMMDASHAMSHYAYRPADEVRSLLMVASSKFGHDRVGNYNIAHRAASNFLISLLGEVNHVELTNWPESESTPMKDDPAFEESTPHFLGSLGTPEGQKKFAALWEQAQAEKAAAESAEMPAKCDD